MPLAKAAAASVARMMGVAPADARTIFRSVPSIQARRSPVALHLGDDAAADVPVMEKTGPPSAAIRTSVGASVPPAQARWMLSGAHDGASIGVL